MRPRPDPIILRAVALRSWLVAAVVATWSPQVAAEPSAAEIAVARKLFSDARSAQDAKQWDQCIEKLREAIAIKETPGLRFHLAHCEEGRGNLVDALVEYDRAAELVRSGKKADDVEELLGPARAAVEARIGSVVVSVPRDARAVTLAVDGRHVAAALIGQPIPVNPGKHVVEVTSAGREPFRVALSVADGQRVAVEATLQPLAARPAAPAADPLAPAGRVEATPPSSPIPVRTWVLLGESVVTLAALGAGIGFTVSKSNLDDEAAGQRAAIDFLTDGGLGGCTDPQTPARKECDRLAATLDDRDAAATFATMGFVAAGVGLTATVLTFVVWSPSRTAATRESRRAVAFVASNGGVGVSGRF